MDDKMKATFIGESLSNQLIKSNNIEIIKYNASLYFMQIIKNYNSFYLECDISEKVLGHTCSDELGTTIMINKKLQGPRKNFTIAHEIGHLLLHINKLLPVETTATLLDGNIKANDPETQANAFASHLLLPDKVLKFQILSSYSIAAISSTSKISKESIYWRIINYLTEVIGLTKSESVYFADEYKNTVKNKDIPKTEVYKIINDFVLHSITYFYNEKSSQLSNDIPF